MVPIFHTVGAQGLEQDGPESLRVLRKRSYSTRQFANDLDAASSQRESDHHDQSHAGHAPAGQFKDSHQGASMRTLPGTSIHREPVIRKHFPGPGLDDRDCVESIGAA